MTLSRFEEAQEAEQGGPTWSLRVEDNDVTTPDEMTRLLELIAGGEAAGRESVFNLAMQPSLISP